MSYVILDLLNMAKMSELFFFECIITVVFIVLIILLSLWTVLVNLKISFHFFLLLRVHIYNLPCPPVSCWNMKQERGRELHIKQCNLNERIGLAWFRLGMWNLSGMRTNAETGRCPVFQENENIIHIWLKYIETQRWRKPLLDTVRLHMH